MQWAFSILAALLMLCYTVAMDTQFWQSFERQKVDGRYHLQRLLGNGAFGGVFLAQEMIGGQIIGEVAVKLILPLSADQAAQLGELIAMRNLNHPHVVRGLAAGECTLNNIKLLYLVMDVATGTLEKRLQAGSVSMAESKEIIRSIAEGLQFLHSRNMVHRDLKPGNVLCIGGKWQLADFGLIRTFGADSAAYTQTVAGTPHYMPPESFKGEVSPAWDVWSLGVLIVTAFTRQYPFTGASHHEVANAILMQPPRIASSLPAPFDTIVQGCLVKDRRTRITASQIITKLGSSVVAPVKTPPAPVPQTVSKIQTAQTVPQSPLPSKSPSKGRAGRWAAFAVVAVVAAFFWHSLSGNHPPESLHQKFMMSRPTPRKFMMSATPMHVKHTRIASLDARRRSNHHAIALAAQHSRGASLPVSQHGDRAISTVNPVPYIVSYIPKPHVPHHVTHAVAYRPRSTRSTIGDLHSDSSIGSNSNRGSSEASSSSGDISGGLH